MFKPTIRSTTLNVFPKTFPTKIKSRKCPEKQEEKKEERMQKAVSKFCFLCMSALQSKTGRRKPRFGQFWLFLAKRVVTRNCATGFKRRFSETFSVREVQVSSTMSFSLWSSFHYFSYLGAFFCGLFDRIVLVWFERSLLLALVGCHSCRLVTSGRKPVYGA